MILETIRLCIEKANTPDEAVFEIQKMFQKELIYIPAIKNNNIRNLQIIEYRKTHTHEDTAKHFGISESYLYKILNKK